MPLSEKKKKTNAAWDEKHLKRMSLAIPIELFDQMKSHTMRTGETVNGFIKRSIKQTMEGDKSEG